LACFEGARVLVTGAAGFLGVHLCERLKRMNCALVGLDEVESAAPAGFAQFIVGDLAREAERCVTELRPDVVFHLAGGASVNDAVRDPDGDFDRTVPATARLLAAAGRAARPPKLVFFSSAAVYGEVDALPVRETDLLRAISPYGAHKAACEALFEHYARIYGLRVAILRIFSAYGEGLRRQFFWDFATRSLKAAARGETSVLAKGAGDETRDFIHAADVAKAAAHVALGLSDAPGVRVLKVGSGEETAVAAAAQRVLAELGLDLEVRFEGAATPGHPRRWRADISRLADLGFHPTRSLDGELPRLMDWISAQHSAPAAVAGLT
jgi:UDP-glucose 4-epimerase